MKITAILLLGFSLQISAKMVAQNVSLSEKNGSLEKVLVQIRKQTGIVFFYDENLLKKSQPVNIKVKDVPLTEALVLIFQEQPLTYEIIGNKIITLKEKEVSIEESKASPEAMFLPADTVRGTVKDEKGSPIAGATITVKGADTHFTTTNEKGIFTIYVRESNSVLTVSYVGLKSISQLIGQAKFINITLKPVVRQMNDVVVVGYGTQSKATTTGSIASVKAEELMQTPIANVAQGLQARVSGLQVTQNSAAPGGNISVRIRGTNSINGTSEPLYIVDGLQISNEGAVTDISPLSTINPSDIESVEVLKDASATAIYGSRGANGVILITTKRGKAGATRVNYESYYGLQNLSKKISLMDASDFARLENETFGHSLYPNPDSLGKGTDWQDLMYRQAAIQNHQLSISGGSLQTKLALSFNYFDQDGIVVTSGFKRYSVRANIDHIINDRFKVGASIVGSYSVNSGIQTGSTSTDASAITLSLIGAVLGAPPTLVPYKPDGSVFAFGDQFAGSYKEVSNPVGRAAISDRTSIKRTMANFYGEATIIKGLSYRASFSADLYGSLRDYYSPIYIVNTAEVNTSSGIAAKGNSNYTLLLHESILTYSKQFAKEHSLKFTGVFAAQGTFANSNTITANGFPNDGTTNEALQLAINKSVSSNRSKDALISYMGRINYGYKNKYLFDITSRIDGSSKFGKSHKYGFFPAASAAWRIIEENFMKNIRSVSDLKLRVSYGLTGNAGAISPYQSLATVSSNGGYQFNNAYGTGISPSGIPNPDLKWEKSTQADIGLDLGLFDNRLTIVADVYHKTTDDLLYILSLPLSSGYASITGNFGKLENKGFELAANAKILTGKVKWDVTGNFSINRNKVLDLDGGITQEVFTTSYSILRVGQPLSVFKTYVFDGIYQQGETILPGADSHIGGVKVKDLDKSGTITAEDQMITGNPNPDFIYGFSTNLRYKNFDFSTFFSGSQGNDLYNLGRFALTTPLGNRNMLKEVVNRWTPTNPSNTIAGASQGSRLPISDDFVEDGSYLRCKNMSVGYSLPKVKGIQKIRVYLSANNLFIITKYSGYDPEVNTYGNSNKTIGVDNMVYPASRSFLAGVQVTL